MTPAIALCLTLLIPGIGALLIGLAHRRPNIREGISLLSAGLLFAAVLWLLSDYTQRGTASVRMTELMPGLAIEFVTEPLGLMFATLAAGLWIVTTVYSIGYMRANQEQHQTRFYICFAVALASTMGVAFAGNLMTLFLFYEILTLSTYPLVAHHQNDAAKKAGRVYLGILLSTSIVFFFSAIIWTWFLTGTLDFTKGGILSGKIEGPYAALLLALYVYGIGKAALMPFHRWLPSAMVAPAPVSALLHAVAVVKAGVFAVLKIAIYIFGVDFLMTTSASRWLMWVAAFTVVSASIIALLKDNLKARLAYSTVGQLAYITLGAALATSMGVLGGALHIVTHAIGKITLFMCAGAIYTAAHKTEVSQMRGLGRKMPLTFLAFLLSAVSIIGLPPSGGAWSKWYLMMGMADTEQLVMIGVLIFSTLMSVAYLAPIIARGFFLPLTDQKDRPQAQGREISVIRWGEIKEAPLWCVVPLCFTAALSVLIYFMAPEIVMFLRPIIEPRG